MPLFRETPPIPLLLQFLEAGGLKSIDDPTWFLPHSFDLSRIEPLIIELQPYYIPSKDIFTNRPLTHLLVITLLRQLLREHSRKLRIKEIKRVRWYSIESPCWNSVVEF